MMIYIILGREPYNGVERGVLGVYSDKMNAEIGLSIYKNAYYKDLEIVEEWLE